MACPFDARALDERAFGAVLDEIAPGWRAGGFGPNGPFRDIPIWSLDDPPLSAAALQALDETCRAFAPLLAALREGNVSLVDMEGVAIPRWVWFSGRWQFCCDDSECLKAVTATGCAVEYFGPRFVAPAHALVEHDEGGVKQQLAYGEMSRAVFTKMAEHEKELSRITSRRGRAAFLAGKTGCSPSYAEQLLRNQEK